MKKIILTLIISAISLSSQASVTLNVLSGVFRDANSQPIPQNSLVIVAASTLDSTFAPIGPTAFTSGDDIVIAQLATNDIGGPGTISAPIVLNFSGNLNAGDPLALYWFPTLTSSATAPGIGTPYGMFTDSSFVMPSDGATITLSFLTTSVGGSLPDSLGIANLVTIPEPSTYALIGFGLLGLVFIARRKAQAKA
jgi:hypothetical protein